MTNYLWAENLNDVAVTVSDCDGKIIYMNDLSVKTFCKDGISIIGRNLREFHNDRSWNIITNILATHKPNVYTIEKNGLHKLIKQTCWFKPSGELGGLVELSIITAPNPPHYIR